MKNIETTTTPVQRGIVGNIISRFETKGYKLAAMKTKQASKELLEEHYKDLVEKPFFPKLRDYMLSGPVVCMVWEGKEAVSTGRKMLGATNPLESAPGKWKLKKYPPQQQ